jgi:hypothetical protein
MYIETKKTRARYWEMFLFTRSRKIRTRKNTTCFMTAFKTPQ